MGKRWPILFCAVLVASCANTGSNPNSNYTLATANNGTVYRTNTATGEVWRVSGDSLEKIQEPSVHVLKIGRKYYFGDNYSMTYIGNGKFTEPVKDYSRLWQ